MNIVTENNPSTFAQMVDKLRNRSEEELKLLYMKKISTELADEWSFTTENSNFKNISEDDIVKAIITKRYSKLV